MTEKHRLRGQRLRFDWLGQVSECCVPDLAPRPKQEAPHLISEEQDPLDLAFGALLEKSNVLCSVIRHARQYSSESRKSVGTSEGSTHVAPTCGRSSQTDLSPHGRRHSPLSPMQSPSLHRAPAHVHASKRLNLARSRTHSTAPASAKSNSARVTLQPPRLESKHDTSLLQAKIQSPIISNISPKNMELSLDERPHRDLFSLRRPDELVHAGERFQRHATRERPASATRTTTAPTSRPHKRRASTHEGKADANSVNACDLAHDIVLTLDVQCIGAHRARKACSLIELPFLLDPPHAVSACVVVSCSSSGASCSPSGAVDAPVSTWLAFSSHSRSSPLCCIVPKPCVTLVFSCRALCM